jgi:hypothetical protein
MGRRKVSGFRLLGVTKKGLSPSPYRHLAFTRPAGGSHLADETSDDVAEATYVVGRAQVQQEPMVMPNQSLCGLPWPCVTRSGNGDSLRRAVHAHEGLLSARHQMRGKLETSRREYVGAQPIKPD